MPKKKLTYKDFIRYFSNNLHNKDKHDFEKEIMRDSFEEEAFDGLSKLSEVELNQDMAELKSKIDDKVKKSRRIIPVWFRYTASVIILLGIGITIVFFNSKYWHNSLIKEQVAKEMEVTDSMALEAERKQLQTSRNMDTIQDKPENFIAENKKQDAEKNRKIEVNEDISNDKIEDTKALVSKVGEEPEEVDVIETFELEDEEEVVMEEHLKLATPAQAKANEAQQDKNEVAAVEISREEEKTNISKGKDTGKAKRPANVQIRGVASQSLNESPLYVIDGTPVDLSRTLTIEGKIVNAGDNKAIPGVSVVLEDVEVFGAVTNTNGEFKLTIPDDKKLKTLIASFVGMETQEITIESDSNILVYMEPETMEMDEVVVGQERVGEIKTTSALPPGGMSMRKFKKYIVENLDYSKLSEYPGSHKVKFSFTVSPNGSLHKFNFKNVPGIDFGKEVKRVVKNLGNWEPATKNESNISSEVSMRLKIEIAE